MDVERALQLQDEIIEVGVFSGPLEASRQAYEANQVELQRFRQRMKAGGLQALRAQEARERFLLELQMPIVARWLGSDCRAAKRDRGP